MAMDLEKVEMMERESEMDLVMESELETDLVME